MTKITDDQHRRFRDLIRERVDTKPGDRRRLSALSFSLTLLEYAADALKQTSVCDSSETTSPDTGGSDE